MKQGWVEQKVVRRAREAEKPKGPNEREKAEQNEVTKKRRQMKNSTRQFSIDMKSTEYSCDREPRS